MRLVNCENPLYILNPHTSEFVQTRCGCCNSCRNAFAKKWINRLDLESQQHRFTYMVTLTYSDEFLPSLMFSEDMEEVVLNRDESFRIPLHDLVEFCKDEYGEYDDVSLKYFRDRLLHPLGLPIVYSKDISDFMKRLNKYCFSHVTYHYENFRYFCTSEYGPTTFRPHYHMLLWFDDERISKCADEIISACWSFGRSDSSAVFSAGGRSYVAQYVNMSVHLPKIYSFSKIRQRHQFSKFPSIGTFNILDEKVRDIYDRIPTQRTIWDSQLSKFNVVPVDSAFKSRFFPKLQGYNRRSYSDRVELYGITSKIPSFDFEEFKFSVYKCRWLVFRNIANVSERKIVEFYDEIKLNSNNDANTIRNSLYRLYTISKRVVWFATLLNTSVSWIVSRIEEFWKQVDYLNLVSFYQFQEDYAKFNPCSDLVYLYPNFMKDLKFWLIPTKRPLFISLALESFGILDENDVVDFHETMDFKSMTLKSQKIYKDTHKRHFVNAYRDRMLEIHDSRLAGILREFQVINSKSVNLYG